MASAIEPMTVTESDDTDTPVVMLQVSTQYSQHDHTFTTCALRYIEHSSNHSPPAMAAAELRPQGKKRQRPEVCVDDVVDKRAKHQRHTHAPWWTDRMAVISASALPVPRNSGPTNTGRVSWMKRDELTSTRSSPPQRERIPFCVNPTPTMTKKVMVNVSRRSKKVVPWKIKLAPSPEFKKRAHQWFRVCRLVRRLVLDRLKRQHAVTGFKRAPNWMKVKNWLTPCRCPGASTNRTCNQHPFENHRLRHYLFNLPHPDPAKKRFVRRTPVGPLVEDHNFCPRTMKNNAIHQMCTSIGTAIESLKEKKRKATGKFARGDIFCVGEFDFRHQTQQDRCQSVTIEGNRSPSIVWDASCGFSFMSEFNPGGPVHAKSKRDLSRLFDLFTRLNADHPLKSPPPKRFGPDVVGCESLVTLKYDRVHRSYSLCIPYWKKKHTPESVPMSDSATSTRSTRKLAVALDPGVRTFQTTYDSGGVSVKYGHGDVGRMSRLAEKIDAIKSAQAASYTSDSGDDDGHPTSSNRKKLMCDRLQATLENLRTDAHWKLAAELCRSYEHVMIPVFKVAQMVNRDDGRRKIGKRTVREMYNWSHFAFRQRLKYKAEELGTHIHEVGEQYTTMACGACGHLDRSIGSGTWFKCKRCPYECDRDRGAARTIYIKNVEQCIGVYHVQPLSLMV
jgi:IS605 OrfB family transposase